MFLDGSRTEQFLVNQTIRKRILFQVIYPALLIGVVIECLLIPTRAGWGWNYKDSLAAGLFLFAMLSSQGASHSLTPTSCATASKPTKK